MARAVDGDLSAAFGRLRNAAAGLPDTRLEDMNKTLHDLEAFWVEQMGAAGLSLMS